MTSEWNLAFCLLPLCFSVALSVKRFCRLTIYIVIGMATCLRNFKGGVFKVEAYLKMLTIDDGALDT
jgi:hypothetical protein